MVRRALLSANNQWQPILRGSKLLRAIMHSFSTVSISIIGVEQDDVAFGHLSTFRNVVLDILELSQHTEFAYMPTYSVRPHLI